MLAGLISTAARGIKGGAEAYGMAAKSKFDKNEKVDLSQQLLDMEEQMKLRVDETMRSRELAGVGDTAAAEADSKIQTAQTLSNSNIGQSESLIELNRLNADDDSGLTAAKAEAFRVKTLGDATATAKAFVGAATVPGYYEALSRKASAEEGSSQQASAALSNFKLASAKSIQLIQNEMMEAKANNDNAGYQAAEDKLKILQGPVKSFADVVKAAGIYQSMAEEVVDPMKNGGLDEAEAQRQAKAFRKAATDLLAGGGMSGVAEPKTGNTGDINVHSKDYKPPVDEPPTQPPTQPLPGLVDDVRRFSPGAINERDMLLMEDDPAVQRENLIKTDPVLIDLQKQKREALKAGETAKANAIIAEYNRLVKEKYGE